MQRVIYLDNAATTRVDDATASVVRDILQNNFGNASSLSPLGLKAERAMEEGRAELLRLMGGDDGKLHFTSGGTESNNLAVIGSYRAHRRVRSRVVISGFEHSSVVNAANSLISEGAEVAAIPPAKDGRADIDAIIEAVSDKTVMVSLMWVNNETGAISDIPYFAERIKAKNNKTIVHTDAVQAFMKHPISLAGTEIDLLTVSGHKIGAPKGIGALYMRKGVRLLPLIYGGGQEGGMRSGTENVAFAAAFAEAASKFDTAAELAKTTELCAYAKDELSKIEGVTINSPNGASPYILNISTGKAKSEIMMRFLAERGIYVSNGSACGRGKDSRTLLSMSLDKRLIDTAIRISFGKGNLKSDIDALAEGIRLWKK